MVAIDHNRVGHRGVASVTTTLAELFELDRIGDDRYRAPPTTSAMRRMYGGQVLSQALDAARRTVSVDRHCHSLHAYFVRPGNPRLPVELAVERDSNGRSFSARRITARQDGALICSMAASFQIAENGPHFQSVMPDAPGPEGLATQADLVHRVAHRLPEWAHAFWLGEQLVDYRFCGTFPIFDHPPEAPSRRVWMRVRVALAAEQHLHQRALAYASDLHIMHGGLIPLGIGWTSARLQTASLDHAIWFHAPFRADEWLLYDLDSGFAGNARTLGHGQVFSADGRLVATVMQEGLARISASAE